MQAKKGPASTPYLVARGQTIPGRQDEGTCLVCTSGAREDRAWLGEVRPETDVRVVQTTIPVLEDYAMASSALRMYTHHIVVLVLPIGAFVPCL